MEPYRDDVGKPSNAAFCLASLSGAHSEKDIRSILRCAWKVGTSQDLALHCGWMMRVNVFGINRLGLRLYAIGIDRIAQLLGGFEEGNPFGRHVHLVAGL